MAGIIPRGQRKTPSDLCLARSLWLGPWQTRRKHGRRQENLWEVVDVCSVAHVASAVELVEVSQGKP